MAQSLRPEQVTPADELRDLLAVAEKRLAKVRGSGAGALSLLVELDRIAEIWPELEAQGMDLRPEAGRWSTVQKTTMQKADPLLAELRGLGGIEKLRAEHHPEGVDAPWWRLDSYARERNSKRNRRLLLTVGGVAVVGAALYFLFSVLFPVDPRVQESVRRVGEGERLVQQDGDFAGALAEFEVAADQTPDDYTVWLRVGAAREQLGEADAAQEAFDKARSLTPSQLDFLKNRASAYLSLNMIDPAGADLQAALEIKPDDAQAWFLMANVHESRSQISEAIDALDKAGQYAQASKQDELTAMSRYRMGVLMQQLQLSPPTTTP